MTVDCSSCMHGKQQFCCEGCDYPRDKPWRGSCLHYQKMGGFRVKLTKEDSIIVREYIVDGEIIEEIPHFKTIRLDKLREVVKELKEEILEYALIDDLKTTDILLIIDDLFKEILEQTDECLSKEVKHGRE